MSEDICERCGKPMNDCSWECRVECAKQDGYEVIAPNNLPIRCITASGLLLECEHGDHPDYKFPIHCDYIGVVPDGEEFDYSHYMNERHALTYTDGCIALSLYECEHYVWHLVNDGALLMHTFWGKEEFQLKEESFIKILELYNSKKQNNSTPKDIENRRLECEHADHEDYIFTIYSDYIGPITEDDDEKSYRLYEMNEEHALIYTDGCIAISMHESSYSVWHLPDGSLYLNRFHNRQSKKNYKLKDESITKILEHHNSKVKS